MADFGLLNPGLGRAQGLDDEAFVAALVEVELAWAEARSGQAPAETSQVIDRLRHTGASVRAEELVAGLESGGNALIALLAAWRSRLDPDQAAFLHTGLTSQDVIDSAMMLLSRRAVTTAVEHLDRVCTGLDQMVARYAEALAIARTLGQHAEQTTLGLRFAIWREGVAYARQALNRLDFPAAIGGAAGTCRTQPAELRQEFAARLGLTCPALPWHVTRYPVQRVGAAAAQAVAALGKIAVDVITASREEIAELAEPAGRGVSSSMPHKRNPVLSIMIQRSALTVPGLVAQLDLAAGLAGDERPTGAWHSEWPAWRELLRHLVAASSQAAELIEGITVDTGAAVQNAAAAAHQPDQQIVTELITRSQERHA